MIGIPALSNENGVSIGEENNFIVTSEDLGTGAESKGSNDSKVGSHSSGEDCTRYDPKGGTNLEPNGSTYGQDACKCTNA